MQRTIHFLSFVSQKAAAKQLSTHRTTPKAAETKDKGDILAQTFVKQEV